MILFANNVPTPIAKKNTNGKNLYGVLVYVVNAGINAVSNSIPDIKTITEFAFETPFLETKNRQTISGNKNITIMVSYLNCKTNVVNPLNSPR